MTILNANLLKYFSKEEAYKFDALNRRKTLLDSSDWTQMPDSPLSAEIKQTWAIYRQELRDITEQSGFPLDIEWPSAPSK